MSYEHILFSIDGGIARLTLNRPDRLNSFNDAMHAEVRDALARVKADPAVRVLLLTGAGRGFCAGPDLGDRAETRELHPGVLQDRAHARRRRDLLPAATCRQRARARPLAARRQAPGGA